MYHCNPENEKILWPEYLSKNDKLASGILKRKSGRPFNLINGSVKKKNKETPANPGTDIIKSAHSVFVHIPIFVFLFHLPLRAGHGMILSRLSLSSLSLVIVSFIILVVSLVHHYFIFFSL